MDNITTPIESIRTPTDKTTLPSAPKTQVLKEIVENHLPTVSTVRSASTFAIKFGKFQKALTPLATVLQASNAITYLEQGLVGLGSILGIASSISNIRQKNKFLECLKALKKGYFVSQQEKEDFIKLIEKPDILEKCLSREFIKRHNIHIDRFFDMKDGEKVVRLDLSLHNNLDEIIAQVERKKIMDAINCIIFTLSLAIFIGGMIVAPPFWLSFVPIILFAFAYVMEKEIDYSGAPLNAEMFIPDFIKDIQTQSAIVDLLETTDLHYHFRSNKALFASHLKNEEIKQLDEKIAKIQKAKVEDGPELRKDFSRSLRKMLKKKTTKDKIETVGLGLMAGGGLSMMAPVGPFALIAILPVILAGLFLKVRPNTLMAT